ncbi:MAG TPA: acyl-ACP thioesterase [Rhizomicrobium sp.]|nr:acyl-ACP thioesterase [Rhizomicrobium sp.]
MTIELARDSVLPWECDRNDHLNMQFYVGRASNALAALGIALGIGPDLLARRGLVLTEIETHIRFLRELRSGAPFVIAGGVVEANAAQLTVFLELTNVATGEPSATFRSLVELRRASDFSAVAFDADVAARAAAVPAAVPAYGMPRGLRMHPPRPAPTLAEATRMGLLATFQGVARPADCDAQGRLKSRLYMAYVFGALSHIFSQLRTGDMQRSERRSGAAVEYRLVYRARPRAGAVLALRSGVSAIAGKTFSHIHWLFDVDSGECAATIEAVSVGLDLETRRAIDMTPEVRALYESALIPDLTV